MEQEKNRFKAASRVFDPDKGKNRIALTWVSEEYGYLRGVICLHLGLFVVLHSC